MQAPKYLGTCLRVLPRVLPCAPLSYVLATCPSLPRYSRPGAGVGCPLTDEKEDLLQEVALEADMKQIRETESEEQDFVRCNE